MQVKLTLLCIAATAFRVESYILQVVW